MPVDIPSSSSLQAILGKRRLLLRKNIFSRGTAAPYQTSSFYSGTSTSDKVSATSGSGMGLDVIADTCEKLGGEVALLDNDCGPGTWLIMRWPLPALALFA
jgi:hypothetical protein